MDLSPFWYGAYKLAKYFIYPYTWLALLIAWLVVRIVRPQAAKRLLSIRLLAASVFLIVWLLGNPIVAGWLMGPLEAAYRPFDPSTPRVEAIVVLAGGLYEHGSLRPSDELTPLSLQRTLCGIDLFTQHVADRLIFSGGDAKVIGTGPEEAAAMKRLAIRLGVPAGAVLTDTRSRTTFENAVETKRLVGAGPVALVTSASHMPRAIGLFRQQGIQAVAAPCGYHVKNWPPQVGREWPFHLIPTVDALESSTKAISEYVGTWLYRLLGKL